MSSSPSTDVRVRRAERWRGVVFALVAAVAIAASAQGANDARRATTTLTVRGAADAPITFSLADLAKLPVQRVEEARVLRAPAGNTETVQRLTGILLRDVLAAAKLLDRDRFDLRRTMIVAVASDGYKAVFSWGEIFNTAVGDGVLVLYERDGVPLPDSEGRIALVSLKDARPGPRHVKWLAAIEVLRVPD